MLSFEVGSEGEATYRHRVLAVAVGSSLGFAAAQLTSPSPPLVPPDAITVEVDSSEEFAAAVDRVEEIQAANPGRDVVLIPSEAITVVPSDERRRADEEQAAAEQLEADRWVTEQSSAGVLVDGPRDVCAQDAASGGLEDGQTGPRRYLICGERLIAIPSDASRSGGFTGDIEAALAQGPLANLFSPLSEVEESAGYWSLLNDRRLLSSFSYDDGLLTLDLTEEILSRISGEMASYLMTQQIYYTLFQYKEVSAITLSVAGSCSRLGDLMMMGCFTMDRSSWDLEVRTNGVSLQVLSFSDG